MNGSYFQNPTFPTTNNLIQDITPPGNISSTDMYDKEQSYIENILRYNKGKRVKAYVSYPESSAWQNKVYDGIIEDKENVSDDI